MELGPTGSPLVNTLTQPRRERLASATPRNIAIDTNGNVWVPTSSGSALLCLNTTTAPARALSRSLGTANSAFGIAIDGNNNVFVGQTRGNYHNSFVEFLGGNLATAPEVQFPAITSNVLPEYMAVDTFGNVWASQR